jgi:hypothetical protein
MSDEQKPITLTISGNKVTSEMADLFIRKRPVGWSRKSNAPYYNERYARWLKKDIDAMIVDRRSRVYRYDVFKDSTPNTLYTRINQALLFLCEKMDDTNGTYKKFKSEIKVERERGVGVTITFAETLDVDARASIFIPNTDKPKWMMKLDAWLESTDVTLPPFYQGQLALTPEMITELETQLGEIEGILFNVSAEEIKVIKT